MRLCRLSRQGSIRRSCSLRPSRRWWISSKRNPYARDAIVHYHCVLAKLCSRRSRAWETLRSISTSWLPSRLMSISEAKASQLHPHLSLPRLFWFTSSMEPLMISSWKVWSRWVTQRLPRPSSRSWLCRSIQTEISMSLPTRSSRSWIMLPRPSRFEQLMHEGEKECPSLHYSWSHSSLI